MRGEAALASTIRRRARGSGRGPRARSASGSSSENHTLKRALTDPRLFSGIGNAYSDEILHRARLSPLALTREARADDEVRRLFEATREALADWTERLRADDGDGFPEKVTAFRPRMAVHGRYGEPCPVCGTPVQRIRYADNETNYCPRCQTGGQLLADRSLSRLLREDWPRSSTSWNDGRLPGSERLDADSGFARPTAVRWRICALMTVASFVAYLLRTNMSVAGEPMSPISAVARPARHRPVGLAWGYARSSFRAASSATASVAAGRSRAWPCSGAC